MQRTYKFADAIRGTTTNSGATGNSSYLQGRLDDTTTQTEDQVQGRLLLDVVVGESSPVLELLSGEDQTLLIRRDPLLILDLGLHILDGVAGLDIQGNGLTRQSLDENLHLVVSPI